MARQHARGTPASRMPCGIRTRGTEAWCPQCTVARRVGVSLRSMISLWTLITSAVLIATVDCSVVQRPWFCQLSHCQRLGRVASPVLTLFAPQSTERLKQLNEHPERLKQAGSSQGEAAGHLTRAEQGCRHRCRCCRLELACAARACCQHHRHMGSKGANTAKSTQAGRRSRLRLVRHVSQECRASRKPGEVQSRPADQMPLAFRFSRHTVDAVGMALDQGRPS